MVLEMKFDKSLWAIMTKLANSVHSHVQEAVMVMIVW
jgi:hypothetical protein